MAMNSMPEKDGSLSFPDPAIGRIARRLCIVARNHPLLFGYLSTLFRDRPVGAERIDIVIDRRHGEALKAPEIERRRPSSAVENELERRGFAFVTQPGEVFSPRDAARIEHTVELLVGMEERNWPYRRPRRRPLWRRWQRVWTRRPWKPLAVLGVVALVSTLFATEFRMNNYPDVERPAPKPSKPAAMKPPVPAPAPPPTATPPKPVEAAAPAPAKAPAAPVVAPAPAPAPAPPASAKPAERAPVTSTALFAPLSPPASPPLATTSQGNTAPRAMTERDATVKPVARPAVAPSAAVPETRAASTPPSPDLRLELSRRPTSATGGGFVYTVRVTDLYGQPRSDARVWLAAGRGASRAQFETRMYPADAAGTYRSGVVHPSTLPPDIMVKAQVGGRHVEVPVER
jgi:hypothetical protein